jgi:hypothetical protein
MIKQALDEHAASLEKVWAHDRSQSVGASEIGACMLKTYWMKNEGDPVYGVKRDPDYVDDWGAKMRGTIMENEFWAPAMKAKYGERLLYAGSEQRSFVSGFLSATPDGMIVGIEPDELAHLGVPSIGIDGTIMAECKSIDPRANIDEAKPINVFQTHVQMGLVRELTRFKPTHSVLSYMDASFWSDIKEFVIAFDPEIFAVAKARANAIMTATSSSELEPEGYFAGGNECKYCPFTDACGTKRMSPPEEVLPIDPAFEVEVTCRSKDIAALEKRVDADSEQLARLKQNLKDRMREKKIRKVPGVISWSGVKGRKGYDNKAIQAAAQAAGIDIEQYRKVGEPTDRFNITEVAA